MDPSDHRDYYAARAIVARDQARRATDPAIAALHADFARHYDRMATGDGDGAGDERANGAAMPPIQAT